MKRVVSVSLGSSERDSVREVELLGEKLSLERRGTDGDLDQAEALIRELDGKVDAFGLGGIDLYLVAGGRRWVIRDAQRLADAAQQTPVVDGSGLKNTLEREAVRRLFREGHLAAPEGRKLRVLVPSAVDRFGMAEAFAESDCEVVFGDVMFALGFPVPIRRLGTIALLARLLLPVLCRQPFENLYPTGDKQKTGKPAYSKWYAWADLIGGDFLFIKRHLPAGAEPPPLAGKTILTNTITQQDLAALRERGLARLITTTPELEGRCFGTNVMEAALIALAGKQPEEMTAEDYLEMLDRLRWQPTIRELSAA